MSGVIRSKTTGAKNWREAMLNRPWDGISVNLWKSSDYDISKKFAVILLFMPSSLATSRDRARLKDFDRDAESYLIEIRFHQLWLPQV